MQVPHRGFGDAVHGEGMRQQGFDGLDFIDFLGRAAKSEMLPRGLVPQAHFLHIAQQRAFVIERELCNALDGGHGVG